MSFTILIPNSEEEFPADAEVLSSGQPDGRPAPFGLRKLDSPPEGGPPEGLPTPILPRSI